MNKKNLHTVMFLLFVFAALASSAPMQLVISDFKANREISGPMLQQLRTMTKDLSSNLAQRSDLKVINEPNEKTAQLTGTLQEINMTTSMFKGAKYTAWNSKVTILVQIELDIPQKQPVQNRFSIVKRLRSTEGEPQLDDKICQELASQIVARCSDEFNEMIQETH